MKRQFIKVMVCSLAAVFCITPVYDKNGLQFDFKAVAADAASSTEKKSSSTDKSKDAETTTAKKGNPLKGIKEKIAQAKKDNPNNKGIVGWLTVTGTNIHEPVSFTSKGNSYYLYRDIKGTNYPQVANFPNYKNYPDSVTYLDYRTKLKDTFDAKGASRNYVVYGHNWNNLQSPLAIGNKQGYTMFAQLPSYTNQKFAENNPYIYFSTEKSEGIWKVFSVAYCEVNSKFPYHIPYTAKDKVAPLIKEWQARSMYNFSTDLKADDRIITLSTCTRQYAGIGSGQRFVVVARLLREGESVKDPVKVEVNTKMKKPQF